MKLTVNKWGNSLGIRLPGAITKELQIKEGTVMEAVLDIKQNTITLKKQDEHGMKRRRRRYTETELIAGLSENHFDRPEYDEFEKDWPEDKELDN